jgi:isopenicillin-N epimerase
MDALQSLFLLDPSVTYLNFGSYGACPKPIFEDYQRWQLLLEREPVQFFRAKGPAALNVSRASLAQYIHCEMGDLVFVTSPSYAVNIVAKSLHLEPGDEVLATNIEYGACDKIWEYYCKKAGAIYRRQPITLPITSKETFVREFFEGVGPRTKAIFISHITSATALVLPVEDICRIAKEKGLFTIVDGAHAPGHVPLDIRSLDPDVYTGACHKWMMTPKSCSFMYVKKECQPLLDPLLISWSYEEGSQAANYFLDSQEIQGTRDYSAFLTVPASVAFMGQYQWTAIARQCRELVLHNAPRFCTLLGTQAIAPLTGEFTGQMFSIPLKPAQAEVLQQKLFTEDHIEIPVTWQNGNAYLRYSINAFNSQGDLDRLYDAVQRHVI